MVGMGTEKRVVEMLLEHNRESETKRQNVSDTYALQIQTWQTKYLFSKGSYITKMIRHYKYGWRINIRKTDRQDKD